MRVLREFRDFLKEYKIAGLAIAFIFGVAATDLIKSFVANILMPIITPIASNGSWQTAKLTLGPFVIGWGAFLGALINFILLSISIFLLYKLAVKQEKIANHLIKNIKKKIKK